MKKSLLIFFVALLTSGLYSCEKEAIVVETLRLEKKMLQNDMSKDDTIIVNVSQDCSFNDRQTVAMVVYETGVIGFLDSAKTVYGIIPDNVTYFPPLLPCNLPAEFMKEGMPVKFAGQMKEIYVNEKFEGHPFKMMFIKDITQ